MRIVTSYFEFADEVKLIWDWERLRKMDLTCSTNFVGLFVPSEIDDVIHFCEWNREFHIVSYCLDGFVWNRYVPHGNSFRLAEGNADPNLVLDFRVEREEVLGELFSSPKPWE